MTMENPAAVRHPAGLRPEDTALADFPLEEQILVVLAHQPWASASDLARRLDVNVPGIHEACHALEEDGLIAGREVSVTRRSQRRYVLTRQGVTHVTRDFQYKDQLRAALPLTWQMTEAGVTKILLWIPMVESLYEILPTFWTGGLAEPFELESVYPDPSCTSYVWLGEPTLTEVRWLPRGRLHVVAIWRFERYDRRPREYPIPFFWAGLLPQEDYGSRSLRLGSDHIRSPRGPGDRVWWDIEPPVAAIGMDQFAAFRAGTAYGDDVRVGSVDTAGALVWSAGASHSEWTLREKAPAARSIGHPEAAAIGEGPDLVNMGGMREYRIFAFLADFRGATRADLVRAFHMSRGAATTRLDRLAARGLVTSVGKNFYVAQRGLDLLAARDRVNVGRLVEVTHLDPEGEDAIGEDAIRERRHDSAVAEAAAAFQGVGIPVAAGWRWVVSWDDGQLVPDLWVQLPVPGREEGCWVAVEVEFSAKTKRRIEEKLRSYRLAPVRLDTTFPVLVITGEPLPAKRFDDLAGHLPMLTTTLKEFLTGVWEGPASVWRRKGRPVALNDIPMEHRARLWQSTGRSLDHSQPSPEVWDRLMMKESIWSDPPTEGLDERFPPISPQIQAERDRLRRLRVEAKAETTADKPVVSAPAPPTPPPPAAPAPVGEAPTAEEQADRRRLILSRIHWLVAVADHKAARRLEREDLSDAERLCLSRVSAIITYGVNRHNKQEVQLVEQSLKYCLRLEKQHHEAVRSANALPGPNLPRTTTDPRQMFKDILRDYPDMRKDACKWFDRWFKMVNGFVLKE